MFLVFRFLRFLCKFVILRTRGGKKEWFFHRFFHIDPHCITMTKIENRDFALIFSGKRPFNTLSKINLSDIVIFTMNFHQYLAWQIFISEIYRCIEIRWWVRGCTLFHVDLWIGRKIETIRKQNWWFTGLKQFHPISVCKMNWIIIGWKLCD